MKFKILLITLFSSISCFSQIDTNRKGKKPTIMVRPSTIWLNKNGYLKSIENQGINTLVPDFNKAFSENLELKLVIASINNLYSERSYSLKSLEQVIKSIQYEEAELIAISSKSGLNIEESMEDLRYNNIVIATDADVDGMHIRLLLITFFLQFFPEMIKEGHLYILQTPLFRIRNKRETIYCYSEEERKAAMEKLKPKPEITRFKGLGEISPDEFKNFIGETIRLDPVMLDKATSIEKLLEFYMGKNTPDRQEFIINNLKVELDVVEEEV
jgi:hypothetical protein